MNKPKISVIVPVYNVDRYLEICIDSLINQTYDNLEIILINDGSTDDSKLICEKYLKLDKRIKLINQKNKGVSSARNNGIRNSSGEYIVFVDSDDWVDLDYFERLYNAAKKYDSDIALATNIRVGKRKSKKRLNITEETVVSGLQDKFDICQQWKNECPTNKIYRHYSRFIELSRNIFKHMGRRKNY